MTKLMRMCVCMYAVRTHMYMNFVTHTTHAHKFCHSPPTLKYDIMYMCEGVSSKIYMHVCVRACKKISHHAPQASTSFTCINV